MRHLCPSCQRAFDEPGFCPFDRTALVDASTVAGKATVVSSALPAQPSQPPAPAAGVGAQDATMAPEPATADLSRTAPRVVATAEASRFRAVSAHDSPTGVLEAFKQRLDEYEALVGQTLDGRYRIEEKIGEGGMGVVYRARHAVIERPLAIKVLKRDVMRDTGTIKRFVQEAKAASRIGHPNIVDVTDFGTTPEGMTYSVMEYVTGPTLGAAIRAAAPFPAERVIKIGAQLARALGAAHDKGIVHRDLKPENVFLVDRDGRTDFVKIVDFGIAKVVPTEAAPGPAEPRLTRAGSVFGTPEYMAPEQAAGRGDTDGRVDIYALGVILYEMTCGRVPHRAESMVRTLAMVMLDAPEPPSKVRPDLGIHPELEAVILKALAKKREDRYATMADLLAALERVLVAVGQSVTGSPLYALAPLPPGADPAPLDPDAHERATKRPTDAPPLRVDRAAHDRPTKRPTDPPPPRRSKSPTSKVRHEPEFVAADKKPTFEHVVDDLDEPAPPARSRWPLVLIGLLALGAAGAAIGLAMRGDRRASTAAHDAGLPVADAALPVDAAPADAGVPADATDDIIVVPGDAGPRRPATRDAGPRDPGPVLAPETPNGRGTIMVQVLTKPEGAQLYVGTSYRGPGGTTLEEPRGSTLEVRCHLKGYKDGTVQIRFDGDAEVVLCTMQRIKVCIDGVKNPFDDCEPAAE